MNSIARALPKSKRALLCYTKLLLCALLALLFSFGALPAYASYARNKRYIVPGTEHEERPRTAGIGYPDTGTLRSARTSGGRKYSEDTVNVLVAILDEAEADGLSTVEVVITYARTGVAVTYSTTIETLRTQGQRVLGVSGWELALPRQLWGIDGQAPEGLPKAKAKQEPAAAQPMLFEFAEPVKKVVYY